MIRIRNGLASMLYLPNHQLQLCRTTGDESFNPNHPTGANFCTQETVKAFGGEPYYYSQDQPRASFHPSCKDLKRQVRSALIWPEHSPVFSQENFGSRRLNLHLVHQIVDYNLSG